MADKSIEQLNAAEKIYATDLFVLQQSGSAKKLTGQILLNWLTAAADGHGGIQSIAKLSTSGLTDTYRITLADTTIFDFPVKNGRGITGISKTFTSGLVDTYTITYNDGTTGKITVKNGEKGDKGDNAYVWVKYASQEPTESSHSFGDIPDNWIGVYSGNLASAPTDWKQYKWYKIKGDQGNTGAPATLVSAAVTYQVSDSGTIIPSGTWSASVPVVAQGKYLWTRTVQTFNTGDPVTAYSISRMGIDGLGSVVSVCNQPPDSNGNVTLSAGNVGALPTSGGDMAGELRMNGQPISGLNDPTEDTQAARKGYVDSAVRKARSQNLLDNSDFTNPVNQRNVSSGDTISDYAYFWDRWRNASANACEISFGNNGLSTTLEVLQSILNAGRYVGKVLTVALYLYDGTNVAASGTVPDEPGWNSICYSGDESNFVRLARSGDILEVSAKLTDVIHIALYEGEYTAETLPEYQPKGYGAELAECQRYYQIRSTNNVLATDLRPTMRLNSPTITSVTDGYAYSADL